MTNIAIASCGLGHVSRGIEAWASDLANALRGEGRRVYLYQGSGVASHADNRTVNCLQRTSDANRRLQRLLPRRAIWRLGLGGPYQIEQTSFAVQLLPYLRRDSIDVLHVQDPLVARLVQRARRLQLVPTRVILGHGTEEPLSFLRHLQFVQHLAPWHLEQACRGELPRPGWVAIPNFIDTRRFRPGNDGGLRTELGIPADALVVLTAAAIKRSHKRIDFLLNQFAELVRRWPQRPLYLVVAGGREKDTGQLQREGVEQLGERVRFLVNFPRRRMPTLYRSADVFVLCSLYEMMPIALLEATASGLPCLVNRHPVLEWMVGRGGMALDMAAPDTLWTSLADLAQHPQHRLQLGVQARRHCEAYFGQQAVVEQIWQYYEAVASFDDGKRYGPHRAA